MVQHGQYRILEMVSVSGELVQSFIAGRARTSVRAALEQCQKGVSDL